MYHVTTPVEIHSHLNVKHPLVLHVYALCIQLASSVSVTTSCFNETNSRSGLTCAGDVIKQEVTRVASAVYFNIKCLNKNNKRRIRETVKPQSYNRKAFQM